MRASKTRSALSSSGRHLRSRRSVLTSAKRAESGELPESDELDLTLDDGLTHLRIAQRPELHLALRGVARRKSGLHMTGMAGQLGDSRADLLVEQANERFDPDLLEMSLAAPLPVELRDMAHIRVTTHRQRRAPAPCEYRRKEPGVMVRVVVRVKVGGVAADELLEPRDLPLDLRIAALGVVRGKLEMQSQAQGWVLTSEDRRRLARRPVHHEAGAREDSETMRLEDPPVDARIQAEVVSGDDEPLHERVTAASCRSRSARLVASACSKTRATTSPASNSSASARARRESRAYSHSA